MFKKEIQITKGKFKKGFTLLPKPSPSPLKERGTQGVR
jgi:hypothetical protein